MTLRPALSGLGARVCVRERNKTRQSDSPIPDTACGHRQPHSGCYCSLPCPGEMGWRHFEGETRGICKCRDEVISENISGPKETMNANFILL